MNTKSVLLQVLCLLASAVAIRAADGISNVRVSQRAGTNLVDLHYDLAGPVTNGMRVAVAVSTNGGLSYDLPATHFTGDVGSGVTAGTNRRSGSMPVGPGQPRQQPSVTA